MYIIMASFGGIEGDLIKCHTRYSRSIFARIGAVLLLWNASLHIFVRYHWSLCCFLDWLYLLSFADYLVVLIMWTIADYLVVLIMWNQVL